MPDETNPFAAPEVSETTAVGDGLDCPKCGQRLEVQVVSQKCECGLALLLVSGPAVDERLGVPHDLGRTISAGIERANWSNFKGRLGPAGIIHQSLLPVLQFIPCGRRIVAYSDVKSLCVWRLRDYRHFVASGLIGGIAVFLLFIIFTVFSARALMDARFPQAVSLGFFVIACLLLSVSIVGSFRALKSGALHIRVTGQSDQFRFRFPPPFFGSRRKRFFREAIRRIGYDPTKFEIP